MSRADEFGNLIFVIVHTVVMIEQIPARGKVLFDSQKFLFGNFSHA